ncbi:MAG TPA: hypothetical protein VM686_36005 [Polyangiaceae bacterium]|nr:hypothetical protein [Polyangiaceae bacterium]
MKTIRCLRASLLALAAALLACGASKEPGPDGGGSGSAGQNGTSGGGFGGQGGSDAATSGTGGGGGSAAGAGGSVSGTGGAGSGVAGSGGSNSGGASAGCGKSNPTSGERQLVVGARTGLYIVSVPSNYDPAQPYPLGFAFHGRNRNHQNCQNEADCAGFQAVMGEQALLVYMQSLREPIDAEMSGWESSEERDANVEFFSSVLSVLEDEYCVDRSRVFVAGTSSGASFANLLACRFGDRLLAAAPVSGAMPEQEGCQGTPAALVIHGIDDPHVPFASGEEARDLYVQRSGCTTNTAPELAVMHGDIRTKRDAMQEDHGCVDYQGCDVPVRWCEHSYGGYDNSTHGWPPNGGQLIWDFVQGLP